MQKNFEQRKYFLKTNFGINLAHNQQVVALAGNPNVGKSTIFNALTGLHQHTGNWPGKTVNNAQGTFSYQTQNFLLIDLPGTYSLLAHSTEEEIARHFICFGNPDITVVVLDASCLERNLNLALQVMEITANVIICVNLLDEAAHKGIAIDLERLNKELGVPVIGTTARTGKGINNLKATLFALQSGTLITSPRHINYSAEIEDNIHTLLPLLTTLTLPYRKKRWLALRLLEGDPALTASIYTEALAWTKK